MKKVGAIYLILLAGLIHGLLYVFLLPPWQHYDEPGHFEVAWLIANKPGLLSAGEYDQGMRREVAASMVEHGFFKDLNIQPNLLDQNTPIWIGISQTDNPPIYYCIASLPLRLVPTSDIVFQLYLCRLVSLLLYLLTLLAACGAVSELTRPGNPARWLVPAMLVLLPGFTELMTAVNSDVGAVAFFSLFLWANLSNPARFQIYPVGCCLYTGWNLLMDQKHSLYRPASAYLSSIIFFVARTPPIDRLDNTWHGHSHRHLHHFHYG